MWKLSWITTFLHEKVEFSIRTYSSRIKEKIKKLRILEFISYHRFLVPCNFKKHFTPFGANLVNIDHDFFYLFQTLYLFNFYQTWHTEIFEIAELKYNPTILLFKMTVCCKRLTCINFCLYPKLFIKTEYAWTLNSNFLKYLLMFFYLCNWMMKVCVGC